MLLFVLTFTPILCTFLFVLTTSPAVLRRMVAAAVRRNPHDNEQELPPDWWDEFETDFRAYASTSWRAARDAERQL